MNIPRVALFPFEHFISLLLIIPNTFKLHDTFVYCIFVNINVCIVHIVFVHPIILNTCITIRKPFIIILI